MADRYLLESGAPDGYLLEDGSGVLLLETPPAGVKCLFNISQFRAGFAQVRSGLQVIEDQLVCALGAGLGAYWDPSKKGTSITLSSSDTVATSPTGALECVLGVTPHGSDIHYAEFEVSIPTLSDGLEIGVGNASVDVNDELAATTDGVSYTFDGSMRQGFSTTAYGNALADGDVVGIMDDINNNLLYISINDVWQNGADPVAGTGGFSYSGVTGSHYLGGQPGEGSDTTITLRVVAGDFTGTKPSVATAWG